MGVSFLRPVNIVRLSVLISKLQWNAGYRGAIEWKNYPLNDDRNAVPNIRLAIIIYFLYGYITNLPIVHNYVNVWITLKTAVIGKNHVRASFGGYFDV